MQFPVVKFWRRGARGTLVLSSPVTLGACGGGESDNAIPTSSVAMQVEMPQAAVDLAAQVATPLFHTAPVLLDEPEDTDSVQRDASAGIGPHIQSVPAQLSALSTKRLTLERLRFASRYGVGSVDDTTDDSDATPLAAGSVVATYTPAQIRAAYNLPALPASSVAATAAQA